MKMDRFRRKDSLGEGHQVCFENTEPELKVLREVCSMVYIISGKELRQEVEISSCLPHKWTRQKL